MDAHLLRSNITAQDMRVLFYKLCPGNPTAINHRMIFRLVALRI
jgi:hypothetical protein